LEIEGYIWLGFNLSTSFLFSECVYTSREKKSAERRERCGKKVQGCIKFGQIFMGFSPWHREGTFTLL
jgi:hypothetical protein